MKVAALLLSLSLYQGSAQLEYRNPELNLAFSHSKAWTFTTDKKGVTRATIPMANSVGLARLEIFSVMYNADRDLWENIEKDFLKQLKGDVVRQWREQILGVPLLLTRGTYNDKGDQKAILSGLMYAKAPRKLRFRLIAPADGFDSVEFEFRSALQTLHSIDGSTPATEDPNRKVTPDDMKVQPILAPPKVMYLTSGKANQKIVKGSQSIDVKAGGKNVSLRFETGWAATKDESGTITLTGPDAPSPIHVNVNSLLDSDSPLVALFKASSQSLNDYLKVATREETMPKANTAGAMESTVWRTGTSAKGPMASCEAAGLLADFYWLATYRQDATLTPAQRRAVDTLLGSMSVELTP